MCCKTVALAHAALTLWMGLKHSSSGELRESWISYGCMNVPWLKYHSLVQIAEVDLNLSPKRTNVVSFDLMAGNGEIHFVWTVL